MKNMVKTVGRALYLRDKRLNWAEVDGNLVFFHGSRTFTLTRERLQAMEQGVGNGFQDLYQLIRLTLFRRPVRSLPHASGMVRKSLADTGRAHWQGTAGRELKDESDW